ncbi:MAG: efflux RND transporter periplasmic adaptor subunit [Gammaproteobacteria bacterium]|nr:efflux RND transporter periplasmic adaptor subunit [Gammaproteobacteria bacterium]MDH5652570.1 efflux RND transporter periplasmic adaptor subunit [Gammaproteobacteria bacterium]
MSKYNKVGFVPVMVILSLLAACSDDKSANQTTTETAMDHAQKHLDPKYVCPMHPNIIRDKPGNCPICGMTLIKKEPEQVSKPAEKKILYWVAPMDPSYRRDGPGKSPMGMDLVPVYDEGGDSDVTISSAVENNLGVRTLPVERGKLWRKIDTVGYVDFDENRISHIHLRSTGWIEKLIVHSEGERVKKGQLLFELYSPELVNAQDDYIQALRTGNKFLLSASRERLQALGISDQQIKVIQKKMRSEQFVRVYAPQDGIVAKLMVREGMYVSPQMEVMSLADLSSIWILGEVFESQANWVKEGQPADVRLSYIPGREWEGSVEYIYPSLNQKTRTLKVRLRFDNPDEVLKPNMFANVSIYGGPKEQTLIIPREALIRGGGDDRVILALGKGRFRAVRVTAGIESGNWIEIMAGLQEGDRVVTSGQFLIDSEASQKASFGRMQSPSEPTEPSMDKTRKIGKAQTDGQTMDTSAPAPVDHSAHQSMEKPVPVDHSAQQAKDENVPAAMEHSQHEAQAAPLRGRGVLHEILPAEHKVKMSHDPIPALQWSSMTMYFKVKPEVKLDGLNVDDKVEFELENGTGGYVIKTIRLAK